MSEYDTRKVVVVQASAEGFRSLYERLDDEYGEKWPPSIRLLNQFESLLSMVEDGATLVVAGTLRGDPSLAVEYLETAKHKAPNLIVVAYAYSGDLPGFEKIADHLCEKKPGRRGDNLPGLLRRYLETGRFELPT